MSGADFAATLARLAARVLPPDQAARVAPPPTVERERKHERRERERTEATKVRRSRLECSPRDFRRRTQTSVRLVLHHPRHAREWFARLPRAWRPALARVLARPGRSRELAIDFRHQWQRGVLACAVLLWCERRKSDRHGALACVDGFTEQMIRTLFVNRATGAHYSVSRLFASSYRPGSDEHGWMTAIERAGLVWTQQPRLADANPRFVGTPREDGSRWAFAVRWLRAEPPAPS